MCWNNEYVEVSVSIPRDVVSKLALEAISFPCSRVLSPWFLVPGPSLVPRPWSRCGWPKKGGPWTTEGTKDQERKSKDSRYIDLKNALACLVAVLCVACGPSEEDIKRDVRTRFDANQTIAPLALSIEVKRQVVYLSGKTGTPAEQQQAMALAKDAKGVKLVVNDMWLNNSSLADKVKEALGQDAVVGKIPIDVEAQGDLIRLSSDQTNREERERIMKIASSVEGVKEVEDRMR